MLAIELADGLARVVPVGAARGVDEVNVRIDETRKNSHSRRIDRSCGVRDDIVIDCNDAAIAKHVKNGSKLPTSFRLCTFTLSTAQRNA